MDQKILNLYQNYQQNRLDRRGFLKKLIKLTGGTAAALALLPVLEQQYSRAEVIAKDDPRLHVYNLKYPGYTGPVKAHLAIPEARGKYPGVIVIHENRGLNPHTEDVARRVALEGFVAIAPDALSPLGGTPQDSDKARSLMRKLERKSTIKNFIAAVKYLRTHPQTNGKVGCMGFCWGGGMTNQVAVNSPLLIAAVPFYGSQPVPEDVPKIKASLLCHYAGNDKRINVGIEAFEKALKVAGIDYQIFMYEGAGHAFFNDTRPQRFHKEAAELAWKRTIAFFKKKLKT